MVRYGRSHSPSTPRRPEVPALAFDLPGGVAPAGLAEPRSVQRRGLVAQLLLHAHLYGQAVAVPAGHVGRVIAVQDPGLDDDVLQYLVVGMADVDRTVGVGRAVKQDELFASRHVLADARVAPLALPLLKHSGLAARQVGPHRKCGTRQVQGVAVIGHGKGLVSRAEVWRRTKLRARVRGPEQHRDPSARAIRQGS